MGYMTDGLTFNTLRGGNNARLPEYKNALGVPVCEDWTPAQWFQALIGEAGEYANWRKKFERGDLHESDFRALAASEIADFVIYADILAGKLGIDLGRAVLEKFNATSEKIGSRVRLAADDWHYVPEPPQARAKE